ncbi:MAG: copper chaperone PCu(A)C [Alphaproteobacteria bacterium]
MPSSRPKRYLSMAVGLYAFASLSAFAGEMPMVSDAWVPLAPNGAKMHAVYLTLHNSTAAEASVVGADSPQYMNVEIHHSRIVDGVATMTRQDQITLPSGGMLEMAPGGFHLMLMHPNAALKEGDAVDINLHMAKGGTLSFKAMVRKSSGMSHGGHSGHKMN